MAEVCANEELAISIANRMAANDVNIFMVRIVPVIDNDWQVTIRLLRFRVSVSKKRFAALFGRRG